MDPVRASLDRELIISAALHDVRGPLTAIQGWAELEEERGRAGPLGALARMLDLLDVLGDAAPHPPHVAELEGHLVRVRGPIDVLKMAIDDLPHREVRVAEEGETVAVRILGVPLGSMSSGWSLAQVRRWLAEGGAPLAGARLRVAARTIGAVRHDFAPVTGTEEGTATIWLARG